METETYKVGPFPVRTRSFLNVACSNFSSLLRIPYLWLCTYLFWMLQWRKPHWWCCPVNKYVWISESEFRIDRANNVSCSRGYRTVVAGDFFFVTSSDIWKSGFSFVLEETVQVVWMKFTFLILQFECLESRLQKKKWGNYIIG